MSFSYIDNTDLVEHLKKGNESAYTYLVNSNYRLLFNYALSLTNDTAMAQDIVQEVFLYVWKNRKNLNKNLSLKNYLYKITYNKFINQYHKKRAVSTLERAYIEALNETIDDDNKELLERKASIIEEGITNLPNKCRETFLLSKKEGLTNIEIAEYLNISIKTVEGHITKAFSILRKTAKDKINNVLFLIFGHTNRIKSN